MQLFHLLTHDEPIGGLGVSDTCLRFALLKLAKNGKDGIKTEIKFLLEQPLEQGVVDNGIIKKEPEFIKSLALLFKKSKTRVRYVIVSIPADNVYCKTFSFPETVRGPKLEETMKLIVDFQLPIKKDEVYLDWEKTSNTSQSETFLAAIAKPIIDAYTKALEVAGLKPVVIEFHQMSFSRIMDETEKNTAIFTLSGKTSSAISVVKDKTLYFNRVINHSFLPQKLLQEEVGKVGAFFESETGLAVGAFIDSKNLKISPLLSDQIAKKDAYKWAISLGAAWRGLIPRSEDTLVSLMPIGTEEAYEQQKAMTFSGFLSGVIISLCLFFMLAFGGVWFLMVTLQQNTLSKVDTLSTLPVQNDLAEMESQAKELNNLVSATSSILKAIPQWSHLLEELRQKVVEGIYMTELLVPSTDGIISIKGVAQNRRQLNLFKKSLDESSFLTEVKMPLTNLEQKENIPFSINFKVKDTNSFYSY